MKHTTIKLVALMALVLMLAFFAILISFHFIMNEFIRNNAEQAILNAIDEFALLNDYTGGYYDEEEDEGDASVTASLLYVNSNYEPYGPYGGRKQGLINYCKNNPRMDGSIVNVITNKREYYVSQLYENSYDGVSDGIWIIYTDITSDRALVRQVDLAIVIIMLLCGSIACFFGMRTGISIERGQERQKKFFENASHELKTPLMSIQGYAEGICDGVIEDRDKAIGVIMSEADKMAALVDEILCLSRIESGDIKLCLENVSVAGVINDCLVSLESVILKKEISIVAELEKGTVKADQAQFETAVINLLTNAVKYSESTIKINFDGRVLSVWNDGCNISQQDIPHMFERFYIGKNGSTGIGLALTKEIAQKHGWNINVQIQDGGLSFSIKF